MDFHDRLLLKAGVSMEDARPYAWDTVARASGAADRRRLVRWLERHDDAEHPMVVKDPRLSWFLPMWQESLTREGASASYLVMLRPPAEVVTSKRSYYIPDLDDAQFVAGWVNMMLRTEALTRPLARAVISFDDLLEDPVETVARAGAACRLDTVREASADAVHRATTLVDPGLRRVTTSWSELRLPPRLRTLAEGTYDSLRSLTREGARSSSVEDGLDVLTGDYWDYYLEAESVSRHSVEAAVVRYKMRSYIPPNLYRRIPMGLRTNHRKLARSAKQPDR